MLALMQSCSAVEAAWWTLRQNYYFVFYSERLDVIWIMSSEQFIAEAVQNKTGTNKGKRSIWFNGMKQGKEYPKARYEQ